MNSKRLEYLTQPEVAEQLKRNPLVILPAGSVEQHGPHLPAGTDIFAANIIAEAVAEKMEGLVIPGGPLGVTPFHMPFEATITLSHETYIRVVVETCQSLAQHGAKRLMLLNWHEGNSSSLAIAAERLHREFDLSVLTVQACYVAQEMYGPTSGGLTHGGEIETLAIMASYPDLVYLDRVSRLQMEAMVLKWINYAELELINLFCPILELLRQQGGMANQKKQPLKRTEDGGRSCISNF